MTTYVAFDPYAHSSLPLYELVTEPAGSGVAFVWHRSDATAQDAAIAPWNYAVAQDDLVASVQEIVKHLPGEHDQRRHAPVTVTRGSTNIPRGQYESLASGATRGQAESQMNKMAGARDYKEANKKGYYTVKIGDTYHVINTKPVGKPKPAPEPKPQPEPKTSVATQRNIPNTSLIEPGIVDRGVAIEGQRLNNGYSAEARVVAGLKKLPLSHQGALKKVSLVESLPDCAGIAHITDRWVELAIESVRGPYGTYATVHEIGHVLLGDLELYRLPRGRNETLDDRKLRKTAGRELRKLYNKRAKAAGVKTGHWIYDDAQAKRARNSSITAVSSYAKTNANEFAAESYAFYVLQPNAMKRIDPEAYTVVKDLFKGQEYTDAGIKYKHLPGQHDQRRHAPVSVKGSANIPAGEYDSQAVGTTRWQAESQMNKLAGVKNYKDANAKGYFTVKVGDEYHVINTKANNGKQEPPQISRHELVTSPEEAAAIVSKLSAYSGGDPYHNRLLIDQLKATPTLAHQAVAYVKAIGGNPSSLSDLGLAVGYVIRSGSAEGALQYGMDFLKTTIAHYDEVLDGLKVIKKPSAKIRHQIEYGEELRQHASESLAGFEVAMGRLLKETPMEPVQSTVRLRKPKLGTIIRTKGGRLNVSSTIDETTHAIAPYGANFGVKDVADAIAEQGLMVVNRSSMLEHDDRIGHNQIKAKLDEIANDYASQLTWLGVGTYHRMSKAEMEDADYRSKRSADIAARKASRKKLKHLPGEHDQRRHAPGSVSMTPGKVTVTRGSANIAKGEYHTYGSYESRWIAEKQMNDLAGVKDYKAANANGWFTVKIGNAYHIIYTKKNEPTTGPKQAIPTPKEPKPIVQGRMRGSFEFPSYLAGKITEPDAMLEIAPGTVHSGIKKEGSTKNRERIMRTLKLLPIAHQRLVSKLVAIEGESFLGDDGKQLAGSANIEHKRIRIATDCDFGNSDGMPPYSSSLVHEVGHMVLGLTYQVKESMGYKMLRSDVRMRLEDIWKVRAGAAGLEELPTGNYQSFEKSKNMLAVSWYSKTNPGEFAAEAYSYYVTKPMVLWREDPVTYAVMKDLFGGHEYITEDQKTYAPDMQ